uniref:AcidPPc domain-containing protein n=1 Tax=Ascaris lumbricoides TaxID=6252 RepID=A0A0M3IR46_ASCLU
MNRNRAIPAHKELAAGSFILNVLLGLVFVAFVILIPRHFLQPYHRGFYCDDETIRLPYVESIIPTYALVISLLTIPAIIIVLTEVYRSSCVIELYSWKGYNIGPIFANSFKFYGYHLLALLISLSMMQATKYFTGRLRPNFIDVCKPDIALDVCNDHTYINNYKCFGTDLKKIRDGRMSFFSGHAALALTAATFLVIYLHSRIPRKHSVVVLRSIIQITIVCVGFYIGFTRIIDNKHHWTDVVVGYIVGVVVGYLTTIKIANMRMPVEDFEEPDIDLPFIDSEDSEGDQAAPKYKTSVVRIEPTELRIFA